MQNHVAVVARLALVGDVIRMRMTSIGGEGALVAKVHRRVGCDDVTCEVSAATWALKMMSPNVQ